MALKKIQFTFSVEAPVLAAFLTQASAVSVSFQGEQPKQRKLLSNGSTPPALGSPKTGKGNNGRPNIKVAIKDALKEGDKSLDQLRDAAEKVGYSRKSVSSQVDLMKKDGVVKALGRGMYTLTAKGAK